jgi:hypothetical protein
MTRAAGIPGVQEYVFNHSAPPKWKGKVERRDVTTFQKPSLQLTWMCRNPNCRLWTFNGAHKTGRCNHCQWPRTEV